MTIVYILLIQLKKDNVERVKKISKCTCKEYETKCLKWFEKGLQKSIETYDAVHDIPEGQRVSFSELATNIEKAHDCAKNILEDMPSMSGFSLWQRYQPLLELCLTVIEMYELYFPSKKKVVGDFTDAGPRVGVSNFEARFRMAELSRMHKTSRRTRLH